MDNNPGTFDSPALNYRSPNIDSVSFNNSNNVPVYTNSSTITTPLGRVYTSSAPPVPARPVRNAYVGGYSPYSSPYSSYGGFSSFSPSFGGYGYGFRPGYGSYGSYGYGSGYYGNGYPESRFIQLAEESSRPAFQTIQSILHAFSSVTMMFESSFHAIYSSYMSVLGVADNFAKLRSTFSQIFSAFAIIRTLNWIYRKFLYMLGINKEIFSKESIWSEALSELKDGNASTKTNKKRSWPLLAFMSILIGGPYILFKLMSELYPSPLQETWVPSQQPGSLAVALYDFQAASDQELSFSAQQRLMIAPKKYQPHDCPGWFLACNENRKIGLVPNNYIGMLLQSEKTGQTYIEHNGQTYQQPRSTVESEKKSGKEENILEMDKSEKIERVDEDS